MPRKAKGIHTCPENAGIKNADKINIPEMQVDEDYKNDLAKINELARRAKNMREDYKGKWTDEEFANCIDEFFDYCEEAQLKVCKAGLRIWLSVSSSQYNDWENKPEKYGFKSELILYANDRMEFSYIGRAEKYPTANLFLLKTSHRHIEASKLDITTNGKSINANENEVQDLVSKLGLDQ